MEKEGLRTERALEDLHKKYSKKRFWVNVSILGFVGIIMVVFFVLLYVYFYSPEKTIGLGAEIENVLVDEKGENAYIKLKGGSLVNVTKIRFSFISGFDYCKFSDHQSSKRESC